MARFISTDPAGYIDGPNVYAYCRGNPIIYVDPTGLAKKHMFYGSFCKSIRVNPAGVPEVRIETWETTWYGKEKPGTRRRMQWMPVLEAEKYMESKHSGLLSDAFNYSKKSGYSVASETVYNMRSFHRYFGRAGITDGAVKDLAYGYWGACFSAATFGAAAGEVGFIRAGVKELIGLDPSNVKGIHRALKNLKLDRSARRRIVKMLQEKNGSKKFYKTLGDELYRKHGESLESFGKGFVEAISIEGPPGAATSLIEQKGQFVAAAAVATKEAVLYAKEKLSDHDD